MELYFYIAGPKRARRKLYFEQGTFPSFEVLAYPVPHKRFCDHLPRISMCAFECYFRFLELIVAEVLVKLPHVYFR